MKNYLHPNHTKLFNKINRISLTRSGSPQQKVFWMIDVSPAASGWISDERHSLTRTTRRRVDFFLEKHRIYSTEMDGSKASMLVDQMSNTVWFWRCDSRLAMYILFSQLGLMCLVHSLLKALGVTCGDLWYVRLAGSSYLEIMAIYFRKRGTSEYLVEFVCMQW